FIEARQSASGAMKKAGKLLLATVKGDVHDIGKNIVSVVLACNNYEVVDLGVMVPCAAILEAALKENADCVGLSGLITPSLEEMAHVASEMERGGMKIPLLIGGATTSAKHTAVKIAPCYSGGVIHVRDASKAVPVMGSLLNPNVRGAYLAKIGEEYERVRDEFAARSTEREMVTLEQARRNKPAFSWSADNICTPKKPGLHVLRNFPLSELRAFIDWSPFFHAWEMRGKYPDIFASPDTGAEAKSLFADANAMLDRLIAENKLRAAGIFGIFPANTAGDDDIEVYADAGRKEVLARFYMLRQQGAKRAGKFNLSLADFIAPKASGIGDYVGAFAVTAGLGVEGIVREYEARHDDYSAIMVKALADRLAEAFAEHLHKLVRTEYWGYAATENLTSAQLIREEYTGIRPAFGYPACPDHSEKLTLFRLLGAEDQAEIRLTETCAMYPAASVSGLYFAHPESRYFGVGKIACDQIENYAARKGLALSDAETWLAPYLSYK
ncbi:MAG TPA: vitamin B12 dependent-methionine synthase activation domain-containing protein, partial [Oligoflexia bacterium]|nr:vitamin B12 dependent-methionine synthase activation domain-containing protein [Oligoflexia bacterium]